MVRQHDPLRNTPSPHIRSSVYCWRRALLLILVGCIVSELYWTNVLWNLGERRTKFEAPATNVSAGSHAILGRRIDLKDPRVGAMQNSEVVVSYGYTFSQLSTPSPCDSTPDSSFQWHFAHHGCTFGELMYSRVGYRIVTADFESQIFTMRAPKVFVAPPVLKQRQYGVVIGAEPSMGIMSRAPFTEQLVVLLQRAGLADDIALDLIIPMAWGGALPRFFSNFLLGNGDLSKYGEGMRNAVRLSRALVSFASYVAVQTMSHGKTLCRQAESTDQSFEKAENTSKEQQDGLLSLSEEEWVAEHVSLLKLVRKLNPSAIIHLVHIVVVGKEQSPHLVANSVLARVKLHADVTTVVRHVAGQVFPFSAMKESICATQDNCSITTASVYCHHQEMRGDRNCSCRGLINNYYPSEDHHAKVAEAMTVSLSTRKENRILEMRAEEAHVLPFSTVDNVQTIPSQGQLIPGEYSDQKIEKQCNLSAWVTQADRIPMESIERVMDKYFFSKGRGTYFVSNAIENLYNSDHAMGLNMELTSRMFARDYLATISPFMACVIPKVASTSTMNMLYDIAFPNECCGRFEWWYAWPAVGRAFRFGLVLAKHLFRRMGDGTGGEHQGFSQIEDVTPLVDVLQVRTDVFRFAVVRNPYCRFYSAYKNKFVTTREGLEVNYFQFTEEEVEKYTAYPPTLEELVLRIGRLQLTGRLKIRELDNHFAPQVNLCGLESSIPYDFVVPVEHVAEPWRFVFAKQTEALKVVDKYLEKPSMNVADTDAFFDSGEKQQDRRLSDEAIAILNKVYAIDLKFTGSLYNLTKEELYEYYVHRKHI